MLIKTSKAPPDGMLVRPLPSAPKADAAPAASPEHEARLALRALQSRGAWFSALSYHHHDGLNGLFEDAKVEDFCCITDDSATTAAFAFVFEGRAWLVFRGTNDLNDIARDVSCLPMWHFGFRLCFRDIRGGLQGWIDRMSAEGRHFCIAGHSLGGALAMLAAEHIARAGKPIDLVCTFGCPRVFAPWQASAFEDLSANLPEPPKRRLGEVTFRFVDTFEFVSHVPPALIGFGHVGREEECGVLAPLVLSREAAKKAAFREDFGAAFDETAKTPIIGPFLLSAKIAFKGIARAIKIPNAHKMALYARNLDPMGIYRIAHDGPVDPLSKGRFRLRSLLPLAVAAVLLAAILAVAGYLLWQLALLLWRAPWATILVAVPLALMTFFTHFSQKQRERREARSWPAGKYDHILRQD